MSEPLFTHVVQLPDVDADTGRSVQITIKVYPNSITIAPEGHGVSPMEDDFNEVVLIENQGGKVKVLVWADINQEDPTHVINLQNALLTNRRDSELARGGGETHNFGGD